MPSPAAFDSPASQPAAPQVGKEPSILCAYQASKQAISATEATRSRRGPWRCHPRSVMSFRSPAGPGSPSLPTKGSLCVPGGESSLRTVSYLYLPHRLASHRRAAADWRQASSTGGPSRLHGGGRHPRHALAPDPHASVISSRNFISSRAVYCVCVYVVGFCLLSSVLAPLPLLISFPSWPAWCFGFVGPTVPQGWAWGPGGLSGGRWFRRVRAWVCVCATLRG